jgi:hypothetical protein
VLALRHNASVLEQPALLLLCKVLVIVSPAQSRIAKGIPCFLCWPAVLTSLSTWSCPAVLTSLSTLSWPAVLAGRGQLDEQVEEGLLAPLVCCTHGPCAVLDEPVPGLCFIQAQGGLHLAGEEALCLFTWAHQHTRQHVAPGVAEHRLWFSQPWASLVLDAAKVDPFTATQICMPAVFCLLCVCSPSLMQGNKAAKSVIMKNWPLPSPHNITDISDGSGTQDAAVNSTTGAAGGAGSKAKGGTANALLPKLQPDLYVDQDTLSRLFLVTSKVAEEVKVRLLYHLALDYYTTADILVDTVCRASPSLALSRC